VSEEPGFDHEKKTILSRSVVARLDRTFGIIAGAVLFVLMVVVAVDVIGRYIFSAPLRGSFEYIQICMALLVFLALPVIVGREENVQVEVFEVFIPRPLRRFTRLLGFAITIVVAAGLVWVSFKRASTFYASGEQFVLLPAPLYPVAYFILAMFAVALAIMLVQFVKYPRHLRDSENKQ
jgi:TRAP-type transport system small permease protein